MSLVTDTPLPSQNVGQLCDVIRCDRTAVCADTRTCLSPDMSDVPVMDGEVVGNLLTLLELSRPARNTQN